MNLRRKGRWASGETKFVVEENSKYVETVPRVNELLKLIRLDKSDSKPSQAPLKESVKPSQKFSQSILDEPSDDDINKTLQEMNNQKLKGGLK